MGDAVRHEAVELPKTFADILREYNPRGGRPVPIGVLYRANICTAAQLEALKTYMEVASARNWAKAMDRQRADSMADRWAEDHSSRKGVPV